MATDVEESDTDERPASPKRRRTRLVGPCLSCEPSQAEETQSEESETDDSDEAERLAGAKLRVWQNCQVAKGIVDNAVNRMVEDSILNPCRTATRSVVYQYRGLSAGEDGMEDTAVSAAIRDRGLVRVPCLPRDELRLNATGRPSETSARDDGPSSPVDADSVSSLVSASMNVPLCQDLKDESDREQDFLDRAVAEAIKKKGLSALSVDYG